MNTDITIPAIQEQTKIGLFFDKLDKLINLQQDKVNALKTLKNGYLQKLFAGMYSTTPQLRFKGFNDPWKEYELGNIAIVTKLAGFEFTKYINYSDIGKIMAIRGVNIGNNKLDLSSVKYIDGSDLSKLNRSKLYKNDIVFTYVGTLGKSLIINEDDKFYLAPNVALIRLKQKKSANFIQQLISTKDYYKGIIFPFIATSSQPALSMQSIRKFKIKMPIYTTEQTKIGSFMASIDKQITSQEDKLKHLKATKRGFLQKLFI